MLELLTHQGRVAMAQLVDEKETSVKKIYFNAANTMARGDAFVHLSTRVDGSGEERKKVTQRKRYTPIYENTVTKPGIFLSSLRGVFGACM